MMNGNKKTPIGVGVSEIGAVVGATALLFMLAWRWRCK